jgi:hypothetical protein
MNFLTPNEWQIVACVAGAAVLCALIAWLVLRNRPSAEEQERARRHFLTQSGRLVDGMLLDIREIEAEDGRTLTMLIISYSIAGVDYECAQDITALQDTVDVSTIPVGFPCSVRYQPGNPQNSIVVAEEWSGLRVGLPHLPSFEEPKLDRLSRMRQNRD